MSLIAFLLQAFIFIEAIYSISSFQMTDTVKISHRQNEVDLKSIDNNNSNSNGSASDDIVPTLLLHGLDSSSHTWRQTLSDLDTPAVALDMRGCGHSDLGDANNFCPDAIVEDIHDFISNHEYFQKREDSNSGEEGEKGGIKKFVICGHSMGGRIAMSYSAKYPENVAALIVEDMDIRTRPMEMNMFQRKVVNRDKTIAFNRYFESKTIEDIESIFEEEGYPVDSVRKWLSEGRVNLLKGDDESDDNKDNVDATNNYYSEVNPAFRLLCYEQFFITDHGEKTWRQITSNTSHLFPCHIMVAGSTGTVCDNESLWQMQCIMKEKTDLRMILHRYKDATHSIHNSSRKSFTADLRNIIQSASL
jgi:pimeloyl-ACP methyl ester carboxylesterase